MEKETPLQQLALRLFAIALIAEGVCAIGKMVYGPFVDSLTIDFGFLGLFIGKGLLDRKELWRKWALVVAWLGLIYCPLIAAFVVWKGESPQWTLGGVQFEVENAMFLLVAILAIVFMFCLWQQRVLTCDSVKETFSPEGESNGWWLAIAITSLAVFATTIAKDSYYQQLCRSIDKYRVTIEAVDAETGDPISPTVALPPVDCNHIFPKVETRSVSTKKGDTVLAISWIGTGPLIVGVSADGYREQEQILGDANNRNSLRVSLEKIKTSE